MILSKLKYWSVYTIFRWQFLFTAVGMWLVFVWLHANLGGSGDPEWLRMNTWVQVMSWAMLFLTIFSISTLLLSWWVFRVRLKSGKLKVLVQLPGNRTPEAGVVPIEATIKNIFRPFLGTVQLRIIFPQWNISERILLDENLKGMINPFNTISGKTNLDLHNRGLHEVQEIQVILSDMLKLVNLPVTMHSGNTLLTIPKELKKENFEIFPTATEEQEVRINIPRRVQGEFLSYKDFETGDDIRRIVWKIYAKNKELVVRIPETRDPYASHVYICPGFYNALITDFDNEAGRELLNTYKDSLRQVLEAVQRNQYSVKMIRDQEAQINTGNAEVSGDLFFLATAQWQHEQRPSEIFDSPKAAVVCLSSATPVEEVDLLFEKLPLHVPVFVFALSTSLGPIF
ncbi:MAG TPA: DUF58 domain-containing protein, partial [Bacteroidia bacterium]|nr:DUF58 domain-containing protein [Bacteroidia bacterium]